MFKSLLKKSLNGNMYLFKHTYLCAMLKGYKYRLYPTKVQATLIDKHIGACRFVYNLGLETKNYAYASHRKNLSCFDLNSQLPDLKKECAWLTEIDSQSLQQSIVNLDRAFTAFFKGNSEFPRYKSKKHNIQSFRHPHGAHIKLKDGKIFQPKFTEGIKLVIDRPHKGVIKSTTISRTPTGKYFVSVLCETGEKIPKLKPVKEQTAVGIDLGLKDFIVTSEGVKVAHSKILQRHLSKLKYLQRQASKKKKGSANRKKANFKVALLHEKITNCRKDFLHNLSTQITNDYESICTENLAISNMTKNHKLAQAIQSSGWGMFVEYLKYKSEWKGKNFFQIPTFEPSTKLCSVCGETKHDLTLADREWTCLKCGTFHDRDINAAKNIKNYCITKRGGERPVKPAKLPTLVGALKQEVKNKVGNYLKV